MVRLWTVLAVALCSLVVATATSAQEPSPGELFIAANGAYEQGDFERAIELYRQLIAGDGVDGRVHFNLGNAYLRNGDLGRAIASFRRSRSLLPRDEDIRANLAFARKSAKDAIAPPEPSTVLATLLFWHYHLGPAELVVLVLMINLCFWGLWIVRLLRSRSELLNWLQIVLLLGLLATGGSVLARQLFARPVAVIVPPEIEAHTAPDDASVVRFKLHAGTEVRIRDRRDRWLRISLPDGQQGWIEAEWADIVDSGLG